MVKSSDGKTQRSPASAGVFFGVLFASLILAGCEPSLPELLPKEKLFHLNLGTMEDELDLFVRDGQPSRDKNRMIFFDGLFFITNGNAKKIMEFSSYGDLLTLHYNPETNPQPVVLGLSNPDAQVKNRQAIPYGFNTVGEIAVTKEKGLLVEDRVPAERRVFDESSNSMQDRIILRFDRDGKFLDYLGQEGIGGTPFPYVEKIATTQRGEIVIVTRTPDGWLVFWYAADGKPVHRVNFTYSELPIPEGKKREEVFASLETIFPDWEKKSLSLKISYYEKNIDPTTKTESGVGIFQSRIYFYDVESQAYTGGFLIPRLSKKQTAEGPFEEQTIEFPYEFLGIAQGEKFYFLSASDNGNHRFLIVDRQGKVQVEKNIVINEDNLQFSQFYVTPKGVLAGLLSDGTDVEVDLWRADRLLFPYAQTSF